MSSGSLTITFWAEEGPAFRTSSVYVTCPPLATVPGCALLVIDTSASPLAPPPSLPELEADPPPDTVAVFETVAGGGSCTVASTRIGG